MKKILLTLLFLSFNAHQMLASTGMNTDILISCDPSAPPMLQVITAFCAQGQPDNRSFKLETSTLPHKRVFELIASDKSYLLTISDKCVIIDPTVYPLFHNCSIFDLLGSCRAPGPILPSPTLVDCAKKMPASLELSEAILQSPWMNHKQRLKFSNIAHGIRPGLIQCKPTNQNGTDFEFTMEYSDEPKSPRQ